MKIVNAVIDQLLTLGLGLFLIAMGYRLFQSVGSVNVGMFLNWLALGLVSYLLGNLMLNLIQWLHDFFRLIKCNRSNRNK